MLITGGVLIFFRNHFLKKTYQNALKIMANFGTIKMNQNQIMKIKNVIVAALSVVALVSCGEAESTNCSCAELSLEGFKEAGMDQEKLQAFFEDTYKAEFEKCQALSWKRMDDMQELSAEEQQAKNEEFMADCPAMKELEKLIRKRLDGIQDL